MSPKATNFIRNRKSAISITKDRIGHIMWYAIECYNLMVSDSPQYSRSYVSANTHYHFEDYLKMEFVENYLKKNKKILSSQVSALDEVTFNYETVKTFTDTTDGKLKSDKIDVYVNRLGLKNDWSEEEENLYLAIECKRISILSDCQAYVEDIQKFCDRSHHQLRLPFESQMAFIENTRLNHASVSTEINRRLQATTTIITKQLLRLLSIHNTFQGCYSSSHKKNFKNNELFQIFHLLFDYSQLISN